jgi:hypothetical protein
MEHKDRTWVIEVCLCEGFGIELVDKLNFEILKYLIWLIAMLLSCICMVGHMCFVIFLHFYPYFLLLIHLSILSNQQNATR